jgi:hypothetical protein
VRKAEQSSYHEIAECETLVTARQWLLAICTRIQPLQSVTTSTVPDFVLLGQHKSIHRRRDATAIRGCFFGQWKSQRNLAIKGYTRAASASSAIITPPEPPSSQSPGQPRDRIPQRQAQPIPQQTAEATTPRPVDTNVTARATRREINIERAPMEEDSEDEFATSRDDGLAPGERSAAHGGELLGRRRARREVALTAVARGVRVLEPVRELPVPLQRRVALHVVADAVVLGDRHTQREPIRSSYSMKSDQRPRTKTMCASCYGPPSAQQTQPGSQTSDSA